MDRIVAFLPAWLDACAYVRLFIPHLHTPHSRFLFNIQSIPLEEFAEANVAVVQRQATAENIAALTRFRELGIKIVYDLDDNLWNLPSYNPGKKVMEEMREGFGACIQLCDVLTVSTNGLRTAVRSVFPRLNKPIEVVPNAIDFDLLRPPVLPRSGLVVGYGGTNTHYRDVDEAWDAIADLVRDNELPDVQFEFVGMPPPMGTENSPQVKKRAFVPIQEFSARYSSWAWDLTLAPLVDTRFNISKSALKIFEAAALGIPILVSPVGPYREFCELNPALKYLQCATRSQWKAKIKEMCNEPGRREHYAGLVKQAVSASNDILKVKDRWAEVFEMAAACGS